MEKIFRILGKDPSQPLTVEDFVEGYVGFEEQLKLKIKKIEKYLDDLTNKMADLEKMKTYAENNEEDIGNGLTNKSNLYITIFEASDLETCTNIGECNIFVRISFQGNQQITSLKNSYNPVWNENFKFKINSLDNNDKIVFEVLNKTVFGEKILGSISIDLNSLIAEQDEIQNLFDLNQGNGKINIKIKCILNLLNHYTKEIKQKENDLKYFNDLFEAMRNYEEQMQIPFGIIYCQNLDILLDKQTLEQSEKIIDFNFSKNYLYTSAEKGNALKNETKKVTWNNTTRLLIIIFIVSVLITLLERSNFLDLFLAISEAYLFLLNKNIDKDKLQLLIITFGFSLLYDFIWFVSQFGIFISDYENPEIKLKRLVYFICMGNSLIKICLIHGLNAVKKKILNSLNLEN